MLQNKETPSLLAHRYLQELKNLFEINEPAGMSNKPKLNEIIVYIRSMLFNVGYVTLHAPNTILNLTQCVCVCNINTRTSYLLLEQTSVDHPSLY
jgi:hypothetical protein